MKDKGKIYTAADLERYHAGTMPATEMHALEKAALEDPFLGDALEGYVQASSFESDIKELQERVNKNKRRQKFFILSPRGTMWWRVAAALLIVAGSAYLFLRVNNVSTEVFLAKEKAFASPEGTDTVLATFPETSVTSVDTFLKNQSDYASAAPGREKNSLPASPVEAKRFSNEEKITMSSPEVKNNIYTDTVYATKAMPEDKKRPSQGYLLKGIITDDRGAPIAFATVKDSVHKTETVADNAGNFLLCSPDSTVTATISAQGFVSRNFELKDNMQPVIAMDRGEILAEIVVSGYGAKRKRSATASGKLDGRVAGVQAIQESEGPSANGKKFDQYLEANKTPIYDETGARLTGEVILSFTLDKNSRPVNIKVTQSSCQRCEAEAIKLLQNAPAWKGKKEAERKVVIQF